MASSSSFRRFINGSYFPITPRIFSTQIRTLYFRRRPNTIIPSRTVSAERPIKQLTFGKKQKAGRNSSGRITSFHRGGGAKRLLRVIDLKRNTPSVGVVERIEYDPNRSSRIALVRWVEGIDRHKKVNTVENHAPPTRMFSPTMTVKGQFAFSTLPGMIPQQREVSFVPKTKHVVVGLPKGISHRSKMQFLSKPTPTPVGTRLTNVRDVFSSVFSSSKAKKTPFSFVTPLGLPRIALAGARPDFFVPRLKDDAKDIESLSFNEIKRWDKDSAMWAHRMKRKAAVNWHDIKRLNMLRLVRVASRHGSKLNSKATDKQKRDGKLTEELVPVSYILATHGMVAGDMVKNHGSSKVSNGESMRRY